MKSKSIENSEELCPSKNVCELLKKDKDKMKNVMEKTLLNYSNMLKRMGRESTFFNFTLVYYSIYLIGISLFTKYFPMMVNVDIVNFMSTIATVIILVLSITISSMKYETRTYKLTDELNKIKSYKREIDSSDRDGFNKIKNDYYDITDSCEVRLDIDYYRTLKILRNRGDVEDLLDANKQIKEISTVYETLKFIFKIILAILCSFLPVILTIVAIYYR